MVENNTSRHSIPTIAWGYGNRKIQQKLFNAQEIRKYRTKIELSTHEKKCRKKHDSPHGILINRKNIVSRLKVFMTLVSDLYWKISHSTNECSNSQKERIFRFQRKLENFRFEGEKYLHFFKILLSARATRLIWLHFPVCELNDLSASDFDGQWQFQVCSGRWYLIGTVWSISEHWKTIEKVSAQGWKKNQFNCIF